MTEAYESILRKSLDAVDRRQKWMKIIAVVFIALGGGNVALAMICLQEPRMLYIGTFVGLILWTGGLAIAILGVSNRNAQLVLRAITLISEAAGDRTAHPSGGALDKREG
jgi:hypothetical protein